MYAIMFAITIGKANAQDTLVVKNDTTKKAPFTITKSPRNSNDNNND